MVKIEGIYVLEEVEAMLVDAGCLLYNGVDEALYDGARVIIQYEGKYYTVWVECADAK